MGNITIKYYLNTKLKPVNFGLDENYYPVYVRVLIGREVLRFRSPIFNTGDFLFDYKTDLENSETQNKITNETNLINFILHNPDKVDENKSITDNINSLNYTIISLFEIDYGITYFKNSSNIEIDYFEYMNIYVSSFLNLKTEINPIFFNEKKLMNKLRDYIYLTEDFIKFIPINELKTMFLIAKKIVEFEKLNYTESKTLNIYEWVFNKGKIKFEKYVQSEINNTPIFKKIIESIDFNCKIRINEMMNI